MLSDSITGSGLSDKSRVQRFGDPISDDKLKEKFRESISKKTRENTKYASSVWNGWILYREAKLETLLEQFDLSKCLSSVPYNEFDFWPSKFVAVCRRKEGKPYPPNTLSQIIAGLQRHLHLAEMM